MCEHCPRKGSEEYEELCLEVGYSVDGHGIDLVNDIVDRISPCLLC